MEDNPIDRQQLSAPAKSSRSRDIILVVASFVVEIVAAKYHLTWLTWIGMAMFWLAIWDSTRQQPGRTRTVAMVASGVLLALMVGLIIAGLLAAKPAVAPVTAPQLSLPGPPINQDAAPRPEGSPAR